MNFPAPLAYRKLSSIFRIAGLVLAIALLMLTMADRSVNAQTAKDVPSTAASSPGDWTQFRRDNMQRWNPYETVLGVNNAGNLQLKWSRSENLADFLSDPVVANGVLYFNGSDHLHALDASTGESLWTSAAAGSISTPAVVNGVVYFYSSDGNVYALNARTGAKLWNSYTNNAFSPPFEIAVANGVVFASGSLDPSGGGTLFALDAGTGALLWNYTGNAGISETPAIVNGVVYFPANATSAPTSVIALNARTGNVLWDYSNGFAANNFAGLVVANGMVYFSGNTSKAVLMFAVNASTGKTVWTSEIAEPAGGPPAVAGGVLYVASATNSSTMGIFALNATTGQKLWSSPITETEGLLAPAVANGVVYTSGIANQPATTSHLYALNASTGKLLSSYALPGSLPNFPLETNGTVYLSDITGPSHTITNINAFSVGADLFLRVQPSATTVHQGDLLTYTFPVWNLGPTNAVHEVLHTQVPAGTTFDFIRVSGTPGLATCTTPPSGGTGQIVCDENGTMGPNTTWAVRLTVKVTAPAGTVITENAATMAATLDPNLANNTATVRIKVQ